MKAAIMDSPGCMRIGEIDKPVPKENEVLVRISAAGVCAGDLHIYKGRSPYAVYPCIAGHEMAGVVTSLGDGVKGFTFDQPVVVDPFVGCGTCYPCRIGKYNCCVNLRILGVHRAGGYAEYLSVPASNLYPVPNNVDPSIAVFAEPISVGIHACRRAEVTRHDCVLVLGCGPIGMVTIEVARALGARVMATDVNADRLEMAARMGAETLASGDDLQDRLNELTHGDGPSVVIEATGSADMMARTADLVAAGGRIVILGLVPRGTGVTFPGLDFTRKELTLLGSRANRNCFPEALSLLSSGKIMFPQLAKPFSLWDSPRLFSKLAEMPGFCHKAVLLND